ncbi:Anti-anti-sigma-B factor [Mycobacterium basiliense]|uniref:Anti-sigma factor antagonist n=1 Tax=Mycobacterium basiliense TaxID=2094119 RepID=A0A3S4BEN2_9MYCO|nr:anti-sigma factor antagonist [Mycobacterium basiliense]VDM88325.1 Anti-anti-sigma-B factor [Mycobacterium basiliense]
MSVVTAEPMISQLILSTRLISELGDPQSTLRATTDRDGAVVLIHAGGEVDAYNERTWHQLVSEAAAAVPPSGLLVVDVNDLDFMACCAFTVLAAEAQRCRRHGVRVRLASSHSIVGRIVAACGFAELLPVFPTVDAALAACI